MGRPSKFRIDRVLDAALQVLERDGMRGLTVSAVCAEMGAPSGSLYHRFASRDALLVALWLRCAERFQGALVDAAEAQQAPRDAARAVVRTFLERARSHRAEAMVLNLYRRTDLIEGDWPPDVRDRAQALERMYQEAMERLAQRLWPRGKPDIARMRFALLQLPLAVTVAELQGQPMQPRAVEWLEQATDAVLADCWQQMAPESDEEKRP